MFRPTPHRWRKSREGCTDSTKQPHSHANKHHYGLQRRHSRHMTAMSAPRGKHTTLRSGTMPPEPERKHLQLQMTDGAEHLQLQMTVTVMPKTRRLRFLIPAHVHLYARTCFTGLQRLERRRVCMKKGRQAIACLPCSNYWRKVRDSNPRYP